MNMLLNTPIKVLVVDDSLVFGRFLTSNLPKANSRIQIVGYAANAMRPLKKYPSVHRMSSPWMWKCLK